MVQDLAIPMAIVTTDLNTGAPYIFTRGPLDIALRASCAFPGLVYPVEYEGRVLADGCIVSPVPTAVAKRINGGCVLGVGVASNSAGSAASSTVVKVFDPNFQPPYRLSPETSWARHADILLEPQVHHIDWNDFSRVDEAVAAGADAARQALPFVRELLNRRAEYSTPPSMCFRAERGMGI
jgi:NTE family protein